MISEAEVAKLKESAYLHWCERGRPPHDDWDDWFWAERSQAAYFRWLDRGRPFGDDWDDWFWAERSQEAYWRWFGGNWDGLPAYRALGGDVEPVHASKYACPLGDYVWYRPAVRTPIPNCPTHGLALKASER